MWYTSLKIWWKRSKSTEAASSLLRFPEVQMTARKDQSHRYSRFRVVPHLVSRGTEKKKGARSGGGRRMSARASLVGAYQHSGCYPRIYIPTKLLPPSVTVSTYLSTAVCFVRTDRLGESARHHFIPHKTWRSRFCLSSRFREFLRVCRTNWILFRIRASVHFEYSEFGITFFLSLMHLCTRTSTWHR